MGLMGNSSRGGRAAGRAGAFVFVAGLHVAGIAGLLHMRYSERAAPEQPSIQVVSLNMDRPAEEQPPQPRLELMEAPPVEVVVPLVAVQIAQPVAAIAPPPAPSPQQPPQIQQVSLGDDAPVMLRSDEVDVEDAPPPRYPRAAKLARAQGTVMVWVLIGNDGRPKEARVHRSSGFEQLDQEGRQAVLGWRFRPYRRDGVARAAEVIIPVQFALKNPRRG